MLIRWRQFCCGLGRCLFLHASLGVCLSPVRDLRDDADDHGRWNPRRRRGCGGPFRRLALAELLGAFLQNLLVGRPVWRRADSGRGDLAPLGGMSNNWSPWAKGTGGAGSSPFEVSTASPPAVWAAAVTAQTRMASSTTVPARMAHAVVSSGSVERAGRSTGSLSLRALVRELGPNPDSMPALLQGLNSGPFRLISAQGDQAHAPMLTPSEEDTKEKERNRRARERQEGEVGLIPARPP